MSSRSTDLTSHGGCPECGKGKMSRVVTSRTCEVDDQKIEVPGLMPYQCDTCGAKAWPDDEVVRARRMLALILEKKAA